MALSSTDGNKKLSVRDITRIGMLATILFVQEEVLTGIPNVQLTIFLILLYAKKLGRYQTSLIVCIHVLLDNLVMGSFNLIYTPAMLMGWLFIPTWICLFCKNCESPFRLGLVGALSGFVYSWIFIIPRIFVYKINIMAYLISDIPFEITLAICGFITTWILYKPCSKLFDRYI